MSNGTRKDLPKLTWPMIQAKVNALITKRIGTRYPLSELKKVIKKKKARGGKVKTRKK